jgi:hypothetical protein
MGLHEVYAGITKEASQQVLDEEFGAKIAAIAFADEIRKHGGPTEAQKTASAGKAMQGLAGKAISKYKSLPGGKAKDTAAKAGVSAAVGGAAGLAHAAVTKKPTEKKAEDKKWIQKAVKKPGALHEQLGVAEDKKIPKGKIEAAAKKGGKLGERARFALNVGKLKKK